MRALTRTCITSLLGVAAACGGEPEPQPPMDDTPLATLEDLEGSPPEPLSIASESGCALSADCAEGTFCFQGLCAFECAESAECAAGESCDLERGRCVSPSASGLLGAIGEPEGARAEALPELAPTNSPQTVFTIAKGQTSAEFTLELAGNAPPEGIAYRLTRSDADENDSQVLRTAGGSPTLVIPVDTGLANPSTSGSRTVQIQVESSVGNWTIALVPQQPVSGTYAGRVSTPGFGPQGIPIEFQVIAEPEGALLDDATSVKMRLEITDWNLFAPTRGEGSPEWVTVEATKDDFTDSWVASFVGRYQLGDGIIQSAGPEQIRREMRFQLQQEGANLTAQVRDRFEGLYEGVTRQGVISLEDVVFNGTLVAERSVDAPATADVSEGLPTGDPQPLPAPSLAICDDAMFDVAPFPYGDGSQAWDCDAIGNTTDFESSDPSTRASCALALTQTALSASATTANQIKTYLEGGSIGGESFSEFMAKCAEGQNDLCRPSGQTLCGRQAVAFAYREIPGDDPIADELIDTYAEATREAFLGQQLAAFHTDSNTRLSWLQSQDFPAVVTAQVRDLNEQLLDEWRQKVLDVHLDVLAGQFDVAGLSVMAREPSSEDALAARQALLFDMTQALRGALDATTLAARRWHTLLQDSRSREDKARFIATRARDLYILSGVFSKLSLSGGGGEQGAVIAAGFAELQRAALELSKDFDDLLYARDAEVTVSTSLDPTRGNTTLLADLKTRALDELLDAEGSVTRVLERANAEALSETQLRDRMNNELADLRSDLVALCGLPTGCSPEDLRNGEPECAINVSTCGVSSPRGLPGGGRVLSGTTASEAGEAVLAIKEAGLEARIARNELSAQLKRIQLKQQTADAFSLNVDARKQQREATVAAILENIQAQDVWRREGLKALGTSIANAAVERQRLVEEAQQDVKDWDLIRHDSVNQKMDNLIAAAILRQTASGLRDGAAALKDFGEAANEGFPRSFDDPTSLGRMVNLMTSAGFVMAMRASAGAADISATSIELLQTRNDLMTEADTKATKLEKTAAAITSDALFNQLRDRAEKAQAEGDVEARNLANMLEYLRADAEATIAHSQDIDTLNEYKQEVAEQLTLVTGLELRVGHAMLGIQQRILSWLSIRQRARIIEAKLDDLERQRENVASLVGSPAVLFSRANRLEQAERRLEDAKDRMMDWLVGIEYFAVRPFMDLRIQILLARNTYQLEEIADRLTQIQNDCGGAVNSFTANLSLRDDLLGFNTPTQSTDGAQVFTPADRLRTVMASGFVPISRRVRYRADSSVGDLVTRRDDVLSATFNVSLEDFANLSNTCNAKLASLEVSLVGQDLGDALPTVSILYDGVGQLTSCQPDLDSYVAQYARASSFGQTTYLRSAGRSISPVAGINAFPGEGSANLSLSGLPLASQYTVLIDTTAGENTKIDWSKLDDVELKMSYTYQDVFPVGQCE